MAANQLNTLTFMLAPSLVQLATGTTLAGATRYTTAAQTITIPETTSRSFVSAYLVCSYHSEWVATNAVIGVRLGNTVGGTPQADFDRAITSLSTASKNVYDEWTMDCTANFAANFGAGTTAAFTGSVAVASTVAGAINGICMKLVVTYAFDDTAQNILAKTIGFPIQSQIGNLTVAQQEIGTDGTNPAPANQIPQLTGAGGILPEGGISISQMWLEIEANTGGGGGSTAFSLYVQIDAAAEIQREVIDETLPTYLPYRTMLDVTALIATTSAHALKLRTDLAARMCFPNATLYVTYTYSVSATAAGNNRIMCEAIVPLTMSDSDGPGITAGESPTANVAADAAVLIAALNVQEASPTLVQSGVYLDVLNVSAVLAVTLSAGGQTGRTYTPAATTSGSEPLIHRVDHGTSPWTLVRGDNRLQFKAYNGGNTARNHLERLYAIINYTATMPARPATATKAVNFLGHVADAASVIAVDVPATGGGQIFPTFNGQTTKIQAVLFDAMIRTGFDTPQPLLAQNAGEWDASGWISLPVHNDGPALVVTRRLGYAATRAYNADTLHTGKLDVTAARRTLFYGQGSLIWAAWSQWVTYHQMTATVAGTITLLGAPAADGTVVEVFAEDASGNTERVTTATVAGGAGAFTCQVLDNVRTYFASINGSTPARSANGTPGSSTFSITVAAGGGGGDVTPPTASATFPASQDYTLVRGAAVVVPVVDAASSVGLVAISVQLAGNIHTEAIYLGNGLASGFQKGYALYSYITGNGTAGVGYTFNIVRDDQWPKGTAAQFTVRAADTKGNVLL